MATPTLLTPNGYGSSTCGYCSPSGSRSEAPTSKKYGMVASQMSVQFYQNMIDRGWRRSGDYMYRPDNARTCCPQYTIRLETQRFKPNKKQRQVINRWNRFLSTGEKPGDKMGDTSKGKINDKGKGRAAEGTSWIDNLREYESTSGKHTIAKHHFETSFIPAKYTTETYGLYRKYQIAVHKDRPEKVTMRGFQRFLCDSPLGSQLINYKGVYKTGLPRDYGSSHLLYKLDGKIIGISVIDILPACISSVYFIWDPEYAWASLGKLSAMYEIALSVEMYNAGIEDMKWLYMGYWISNCIKMRYKSEYSPSFLLDPGTLRFHQLTETLDRYLQVYSRGYHPFADITSETVSRINLDSVNGNGDEDEDMEELDLFDDLPYPPPPGFDDTESLTSDYMDNLLVMFKSRILRLGVLRFTTPQRMTEVIKEMVSAVGIEYMASAKEMDDIRDKGVLHFG